MTIVMGIAMMTDWSGAIVSLFFGEKAKQMVLNV